MTIVDVLTRAIFLMELEGNIEDARQVAVIALATLPQDEHAIGNRQTRKQGLDLLGPACFAGVPLSYRLLAELAIEGASLEQLVAIIDELA